MNFLLEYFGLLTLYENQKIKSTLVAVHILLSHFLSHFIRFVMCVTVQHKWTF